MSRKDTILKELEDFYKLENKPFDMKLAKEAIDLTVKHIMEINEEFSGRRIGEIDLNLIYKDEFNIKNKKN